MSRLDTDRQKELEPKRLEFAKNVIEKLGYSITHIDGTKLKFEYNGSEVTFFAYSGWASGKTIKDCRGISNLVNQIKNVPT